MAVAVHQGNKVLQWLLSGLVWLGYSIYQPRDCVKGESGLTRDSNDRNTSFVNAGGMISAAVLWSLSKLNFHPCAEPDSKVHSAPCTYQVKGIY